MDRRVLLPCDVATIVSNASRSVQAIHVNNIIDLVVLLHSLIAVNG